MGLIVGVVIIIKFSPRCCDYNVNSAIDCVPPPAERLPPPAGLSYRWVDAFTVTVSWPEPRGLPAGDVRYKYRLEDPESVGSLLKCGL